MIIGGILLTLRYMKEELVFSSLFIICLFFLDYQLYMKGSHLISFDLQGGEGGRGLVMEHFLFDYWKEGLPYQ